MGHKPIGKVAMTSAERQRLYMQRLRDRAAADANGKQPGSRKIVSDERIREAIGAGLSTDTRRKLKRLARHKDCSTAALIERWATAEEHRVVARLKLKGTAALKRYHDGK
jgi:hypothetical protein